MATLTQSQGDEAPDGAVVVDPNSMRSFAVEAAEVQAAMQPWVEIECYQLGRGNQVAQLDLLDLGNQQLVRESQYAAIHKIGHTPENSCTVSCCTPMPGPRLSEFSAEAVAAVFFLPGNMEFDVYVPAGAITTYVSFAQDEFLQGARALDPAKWENAPAALEAFGGAQQAVFLQGIEAILRQAETLSAAGHAVEPAVMRDMMMQSVLLSAVAARAGDALPIAREQSRALEICRNSRAFIAERLAAGIVPTIPQLCTAANVSERTLQYAFRRYVGMTPLAYLRVSRLNCVRRGLRAPGPETTVTTEALKYGFLHLGRFASDYQKPFGERPSQTLLRAQ